MGLQDACTALKSNCMQSSGWKLECCFSIDDHPCQGTSSPIDHLLPTPLLHLRLPFTLSSTPSPTSGIIPTTHQPTQPTPHPRISGHSKIDTIPRHDQPQPPRPIPKHGNRNNTNPSPVEDIPHPLRQALGFEVFAGAFEVAGFSLGRAGDVFEVGFYRQCWAAQEDVVEEGGAAGGTGEEEAGDVVEGVDCKGDEVGAVEGGGVAGGEGFEGFLGATVLVPESQ